MADETVVAAEVPKAAPVEAPKAAPAAAAHAPSAKPTESEVKEGEGTVDPNRVYTQAELDKILNKVKKNERYRTRKEVEAYYQGRESAAPKPAAEKPAEPAAEDKPPTREAFDSYEAFLDAKAEYTGKKAAHEYRQKAEAEQKQRAAQEAQAERVKTFQAKVNEKYPDLAERAESIAHVEMPSGMGDAIAESELGPDILNHFAENPKDFERIAALSSSAAIREVGRLEARLEGAAKPAPVAVELKKPSAAPAPIAPVGGTAAVGSEDLASLVNDPARFKAVRDRQVARARGLVK